MPTSIKAAPHPGTCPKQQLNRIAASHQQDLEAAAHNSEPQTQNRLQVIRVKRQPKKGNFFSE
jgi:hypothetical protein